LAARSGALGILYLARRAGERPQIRLRGESHAGEYQSQNQAKEVFHHDPEKADDAIFINRSTRRIK
jgi:hypothetical protein